MLPWESFLSCVLWLSLCIRSTQAAISYCRGGVCSEDQAIAEIALYMHILAFLLTILVCLQCYSKCGGGPHKYHFNPQAPHLQERYNTELARRTGFVPPPGTAV
jgi:hypothetical protein